LLMALARDPDLHQNGSVDPRLSMGFSEELEEFSDVAPQRVKIIGISTTATSNVVTLVVTTE